MKSVVKWTHRGGICSEIWAIIPYVFYVSRSILTHNGRESCGVVYAIHFTPFITLGINWGKEKCQDCQQCHK